MLENAIYSVISPEGCATILWRDPKKMLDAAKAMKLTAQDLKELNIIDGIIPEPLGGAHRDRNLTIENIKKEIIFTLNSFKEMTPEEIYNNRKSKFLSIGRKKGFVKNIEELSALTHNQNNFEVYFEKLKNNINIVLVTLIVLVLFLIISFYL